MTSVEVAANGDQKTNSSKQAAGSKGSKGGKSGVPMTVPFGLLRCTKDLNFRGELDKVKVGEIARSIQAIGLIEPIVVYQTKDGYEVGAGFKRYAALKQNKTKDVDPVNVVVRDVALRPIVNLAENILREDLPPIDLADALLEMVEGKYAVTEGEKPRAWTRKELSELLTMSHGAVENYVRAAANLTDKVKEIVREHDVPARVFVGWASKKPEEQLVLAKEHVKEQKEKKDSGRQRAAKKTKKGGGGGGDGDEERDPAHARAPTDTLRGELEVLRFKLTYVKGKEKELTERQVDTLRYVVGGDDGLARMPGINGDDRKAYARWYKEQLEEEEGEKEGEEES
jgi:ParB/RepB/Spo0J family partition protein